MNKQNNACRRALTGLLLAALCGLAAAAQIEAPFTHATRYNEKGQVTGTIAPDPDGSGALRLLATRNTYGANGLLSKTETGELTTWADETISPASWGGYGFAGTNIFSTVEFAYDSYGRKIKEMVRGVDTTPEALVQYSYDAESFVRCKAVRMNKSLFTSPPSDPCQLGAEGSQGPDRIFRYTNDIYGQVWTEERAVGTPLEQVYAQTTYAMRSPTSYVDANGNRTELKYTDGYGRVNERWYPSAAAPGVANSADKNVYVYDANGNVKVETKRNSTTITYTIDGLNRVTKKNLSDNSKGDDVEYDYDARGLTLYTRFVNSPSIGVVNVFDGFGRLKNATSTTAVGTTTASRTLDYQYDANGNRTKVTHPGNKNFIYAFDGMNRAICVSEGGNCYSTDANRLVVVSYRSDGKRAALLRPGGASTNYSYDNAGRLWTFKQDFAGTADDLTNTFYYNPAGQARQLTYGNSAFAPLGNSNRTGAYAVNGLNQYTSNAGVSIAYDVNGNLTSDTPSTYTYDMENRLTGMTSPAGALEYDPLGRLSEYTAPLAAAPIQFLYDGDALVAEYTVSGDTSTVTKRYVHGAGVDEPWVQYNGQYVNAGARRFLHADHQGSIIAHSNSSGAILGAKLNYDAFGIASAANYDRFGYTGQTWLKELNLNYYKARVYHPRLGRFLQTDPIGYTDDLNLYAYVGADPINLTDPSGECPWCFFGALAGAAVSAVVQYTVTGRVDYTQVGIAAAAGFISGGASAVISATAATGTAVVAGNAIAGAAVGAAQTTASTYAATGSLPTKGEVVKGAVIGAVLTGAGARAGVAAERALATPTNGIALHVQEMTRSAMNSAEASAARVAGPLTGEQASNGVQAAGSLFTEMVNGRTEGVIQSEPPPSTCVGSSNGSCTK